SKRAVATLVTETDAMQPGQSFRVALRLRLADGWHTYWKNPGDAGVPPDLTIAGVTQSAIDWPTPGRVAEGPVMTYAYTGEVLLPVTVTAKTGTLKAHADWLVCKDICVPEEGDFSLTLPVGTPGPSAQAGLFAAHDRSIPRASPWTARISPDGTLFVQGPELTPATVTDAWFIPDQPDRIQDDAAQPLSVRTGGFTLSLKPAKGFQAADGLSGVLSVRDRAGMQTDVVVNAVPGPPPAPAMPPLGQILVFAFLGGLILNLMPCVFPILAMKAVGLARHAGQGRRHAIAYTVGVLVTFVALAAALLAARTAGTAAGWGFQFSSPVFVAGMTWLLFAVGLNLSGVFQVGASLAGAGSGLADRHGMAGSFFTGLLAVLVATPCTAPFMGVAVAAGLAAPPAVTMLVFAVMGLGLAAPYVALASMPGLARLMPRPGRWMEVLKQALAFPMYGAAAWLVWVVSQEAGPNGVLATAAGLVLVGFAGWVFGTTQASSLQPRRFGQTVAAVSVLVALAVLSGIATVPVGGAAEALGSNAEAFTPQRLADLRSAGKPVFVNMTAAWCVTCLVNERVAIGTDQVRKAFAADDVTYLKGDWTRQDPAITAFLRQNGRDGVPLYVFFPADGGQPEVLPQILTEGTVLRLLRTS
ncbi:protein-disulfide reductase DsbD family protein, partial [Acidisphaera sp. S103]|uniref:protein-disulfide reductase DsbD family protein n=1 Tax=Acidisphaera sp. S103 TaxID=1747223 RepID=UPI00352E07C4